MKLIIDNINPSLKLCLNIFAYYGMWKSDSWGIIARTFYYLYFSITYTFTTGIYVVIQAGDLVQVWGDISLMTATFFLLFTNLALTVKIFNIVMRDKRIKALVKACHDDLSMETGEVADKIIHSYNMECWRQLRLYLLMTYCTITGWSLGAQKGQLPMRAWYPYDTNKTPAYELTYIHQCIAVAFGAAVNVATDTLVTTLVSQCRCRLRLLAISFQTLCDGYPVGEMGLMSPEDEKKVYQQLCKHLQRHQAILEDAAHLQDCFSVSTFSQFTVSMFIICVTAYQLAFESKNIIVLVSMVLYLLVMTMQVFIYCYQGTQLYVESEAISSAAYECTWYACRAGVRRALLVAMTRAERNVQLTAANLFQLSLATFVSIMKASYTFFTVLRQVND